MVVRILLILLYVLVIHPTTILPHDTKLATTTFFPSSKPTNTSSSTSPNTRHQDPTHIKKKLWDSNVTTTNQQQIFTSLTGNDTFFTREEQNHILTSLTGNDTFLTREEEQKQNLFTSNCTNILNRDANLLTDNDTFLTREEEQKQNLFTSNCTNNLNRDTNLDTNTNNFTREENKRMHIMKGNKYDYYYTPRERSSRSGGGRSENILLSVPVHEPVGRGSWFVGGRRGRGKRSYASFPGRQSVQGVGSLMSGGRQPVQGVGSLISGSSRGKRSVKLPGRQSTERGGGGGSLLSSSSRGKRSVRLPGRQSTERGGGGREGKSSPPPQPPSGSLDNFDLWYDVKSVLVSLIKEELSECSMVLLIHNTFTLQQQDLVTTLAQLTTNTIQVVEVHETTDGDEVGRKVSWVRLGGECRAYIYLQHQLQNNNNTTTNPLFSLADTHDKRWDYGARYVMVGLTEGQLGHFTHTFKGHKTQHLVGLVKDESEGEWAVYMNQLYWGPGVVRVATWRRGHFISTPSSSTTRISTPTTSTTRISTPTTSNTRASTPATSTTRASTPSTSTTRISTPITSTTRISTPTTSTHISFFPDKISDLEGATLNVVTFEWVPSTLYYRSDNYTVSFLYGRDVELVRAVAPVLNFTPHFEEPPNGERWGTVKGDGTWSGIVGSLARGKAHLAIANLFVSSLLGRDLYQGYSTLFDFEEVKFLIRTEPPFPRWQSPALPFSRDTWLAVLLGLIILAPVTCLLARASTAIAKGSSRSSSRSSGEADEPRTLRELTSAYVYTVGLHLQESHPVRPHNHSTRILLALVLLYTLVLDLSYSCNLTAFLTVTRRPPGIQTLIKLRDSGLDLYEASYYVRDLLRASPTPYFRELGARHVLVGGIKEAAGGVRDGSGVFITNNGMMEFLFNTVVAAPSPGGYGVRMIKESLVTYSVAIGTASQSPLQDSLNRAVIRVFEAGLCTYWKLKSYILYRQNQRELLGSDESDTVLAEVIRGDNTHTTILVPLTLDHLQTAFYILAFSFYLAIMVFVGELLVKRFGFCV
ncbi:hypothetical protein Pmani_032018 [Petrolisthes manimaculis]|uniref:Ionotropic glutamate receptor C-terminal domain-containing protein n=1 Tax=Petrolisthes manimaculis TaxID=1843537 RepID=A0AAE1TS21_9EUCA|nr:hypothetical protein Pmani_032018 [Petrolisthes manimaculis]